MKRSKKLVKKNQTVKVIGGMTNPRSLVSSYPKKTTVTKLRTSYSAIFNGTSLYHYDNVYARTTVYRPINGISSILPGRTAMAILYSGALVMGVTVKATLTNNIASPVIFGLVKVRAVGTDHSNTFADYRPIPDCKSTVLQKSGVAGSQKTLKMKCDLSKMLGYNPSSTNLTAHWQSFSSDPAGMGGINVFAFSSDGTTIVNCDVNLEIELDVVLMNPNLILS